MEKQKTQTLTTCGAPVNLDKQYHSLEATASRFGFHPDRLKELAENGYAPHVRLDNGPPFFHPPTFKKWVIDNVLDECPGRPLEVRIIGPALVREDMQTDAPTSICRVRPLFRYEWGVQRIGSCIYFLCAGDCVVYVGQSRKGEARIPNHTAGGKNFDRAYWLPVPPSDLDDVESAIIVTLKPIYNLKKNGQLSYPKAEPDMTKLKKYEANAKEKK